MHSFDKAAYGTGDFFAFAKAIDASNLSNVRAIDGVDVQLGWVRDVAR